MSKWVYRLTDDEAEAADVVAMRRQTINRGDRLKTVHATPADSLMQHRRATRAEIAVSRLLNLAWTGCGKGTDGLRDVGGIIEVRSIEAAEIGRKGLLVRPTDLGSAGVPFVLCSVDLAAETAISQGWAFNDEVREFGQSFDGGREPYWVAKHLKPLDELRAYVLEWLFSTN